MISVFNDYLLSDSICDNIKDIYRDKLSPILVNNLRSQKNYHEYDTNSLLHNIVSDLIKNNLGTEYDLLERVTVLRYDTGDYFKEHIDGTHNYGLNNTLPYPFSKNQ